MTGPSATDQGCGTVVLLLHRGDALLPRQVFARGCRAAMMIGQAAAVVDVLGGAAGTALNTGATCTATASRGVSASILHEMVALQVVLLLLLLARGGDLGAGPAGLLRRRMMSCSIGRQ